MATFFHLHCLCPEIQSILRDAPIQHLKTASRPGPSGSSVWHKIGSKMVPHGVLLGLHPVAVPPVFLLELFSFLFTFK